MGKKSTAELKSRALADLLSIGAEEDFLRDMLSRHIFMEARKVDRARGPLSMIGRTVAELLADPKADLDDLKTIKHDAKEIAAGIKTKPERAAATAIYYAAIAAAFVHKGVSLTRHSRESLGVAFASLLTKPWISDELKSLYKQVAASAGSPG